MSCKGGPRAAPPYKTGGERVVWKGVGGGQHGTVQRPAYGLSGNINGEDSISAPSRFPAYRTAATCESDSCHWPWWTAAACEPDSEGGRDGPLTEVVGGCKHFAGVSRRAGRTCSSTAQPGGLEERQGLEWPGDETGQCLVPPGVGGDSVEGVKPGGAGSIGQGMARCGKPPTGTRRGHRTGLWGTGKVRDGAIALWRRDRSGRAATSAACGWPGGGQGSALLWPVREFERGGKQIAPLEVPSAWGKPPIGVGNLPHGVCRTSWGMEQAGMGQMPHGMERRREGGSVGEEDERHEPPFLVVTWTRSG